MASVTCPHCSTKIRLTRKKKAPTSPELPAENQALAKTPRLPVPDFATPTPDTPDGNEPQVDAPAQESGGFPEIKTRRTRKRVNLSGLQFDDSDLTDTPPPSQIEETDDSEEAPLDIKTRRRKRKQINLDELQLDGTNESTPPVEPKRLPVEPKRRPASVPPTQVKPPSNDESTPADDSSILPSGRRTRGNSPTKPKASTKPKAPLKTKATEPGVEPKRRSAEPKRRPAEPKRRSTSTPATEAPQPRPETADTPTTEAPIIPSGRRTRSRSSATPTAESTQHQTPEPPPTAPTGTAEPIETADAARPAIPSPVAPAPVSSTPAERPPNEPEHDSTNHTERAESKTESESKAETETAPTDQPELDDENSLLPPKFLVADIEADENAVVLPTAAGGTQVVDRTEVTVSHGGQTVTLVASTPEELRRIRLIENLVALVIAGIMLAIAVWLVL